MKKKSIAAIASVGLACSMLAGSVGMQASATTTGDVIAAAYAVGMPESMIQAGIAQYSGREYTSEQCDAGVAAVYSWAAARDKAISESVGEDSSEDDSTETTSANEDSDSTTTTTAKANSTDSTEKSGKTTTTKNSTGKSGNNSNRSDNNSSAGGATGNSGSSSNGNSTGNSTSNSGNSTGSNSTSGNSSSGSSSSSKRTISDYSTLPTGSDGFVEEDTFINMNYADKVGYIQSLSSAEKQEFMNSMTNEEKNSMLKQMDTSQQMDVVSSLVDVGDALGMNFSVDEIGDGELSVSIRDEDGNLTGVTNFGSAKVEDTGISRTLPICVGGGAIFLACGGLFFCLCKSGNKSKKEASV